MPVLPGCPVAGRKEVAQVVDLRSTGERLGLSWRKSANNPQIGQFPPQFTGLAVLPSRQGFDHPAGHQPGSPCTLLSAGIGKGLIFNRVPHIPGASGKTLL